MILESKPIDELDENDLLQLIEQGTPEKKTVEYKRDAIGGSDSDTKEFLADVSSLANASGGHLIIGIDEEEGVPIELCGIEIANVDAEILRLESKIRDGIAPRIAGVETVAVSLSSQNKHAFVMRIPRSWQSPHMVTFKGSSKFYSRTSNGKYPLDVDEIRSAFVLSESVTDRIRGFRTDRINRVLTEQTPIPVKSGPKFMLHLIPLSAFSSVDTVDIQKLIKDHSVELITRTDRTIHLGGRRINFDGLLVYPISMPSLTSRYAQVFRNGCIEFVDRFQDPESEQRTTSGNYLEKTMINATTALMSIQKFLGVQPPIFVMLTVLHILGYTIANENFRALIDSYEVHPIERENLVFPEIIVEDFNELADVILKPLFDVLWNASGWGGSWSYDDEGRWNPRR